MLGRATKVDLSDGSRIRYTYNNLDQTTKKYYKKLTVNKTTGKVKLKKGKYTKGTIKLKVKIFAKGNSKYKSKTIKKTIKIKVK